MPTTRDNAPFVTQLDEEGHVLCLRADASTFTVNRKARVTLWIEKRSPFGCPTVGAAGVFLRGSLQEIELDPGLDALLVHGIACGDVGGKTAEAAMHHIFWQHLVVEDAELTYLRRWSPDGYTHYAQAIIATIIDTQASATKLEGVSQEGALRQERDALMAWFVRQDTGKALRLARRLSHDQEFCLAAMAAANIGKVAEFMHQQAGTLLCRETVTCS